MSKLYNGGASFGFSLNFNTAVPVDTRFVVATLDDLKSPETWVSGAYDSEVDSNNVYVVYPGLRVTVVSEKTVYIFTAASVNGDTLAAEGSWTKLSTSEATSQALEDIQTVISGIGLDNEGNHIQTSGNYTSGASSVVEEIAALDTELKNVNDALGDKTNDTKDSDTVYGKILKTQNNLDVEVAKITASKTLKEVTVEGTKSYETDLSIIYVAAKVEVKEGEEVVTPAVPAHLALVDSEGTELSAIEISDIIGNGSLKSTSYNKDTGILTMNFGLANGKTQAVEVDLGEMLDVNDVLIDTSSADYLEVDLTGGENSQAAFKAKIKKMADASYAEGSKSTGLADAADVKKYVDDSIDNLDKSATVTDGENIHVTISETNGIASIDTVTEDYAEVTSVEHKDAVPESAPEAGDGEEEVKASFSVKTGDESKLIKASDLAKAVKYAEDIVNESTSNITAALEDLDSESTSTDGSNITVKVTQVDGKITGVNVTDSYTTVTRTAKADNVEAEFSVTNGEKIAKGSDLVEVSQYADDIVAAAVESLDSSFDVKDVKEYVNVKTEIEDGKIKDNSSSVTLTYGTFAKGTQADSNNGLATVEDTKAYIDQEVADKNVDAEGDDYVAASASSNKVTVTPNVKTLSEVHDVIEEDTENNIEAAPKVTGLADALDVKNSIAIARNAVEEQISWIEID